MGYSGGGGGGAGFQIFKKSTDGLDAIFADAAARDVYFAANPADLALLDANQYLIIKLQDNGSGQIAYQQRQLGAWVDVTSLVQGETGPGGATGNSFFFSSVADRDLFFDTSPNEGLLKEDLPVVVNEIDTATTYYWSGIDDPTSYDETLWRPASLRTAPGTLFLGEGGASISSGNRLLNFVEARGNTCYCIVNSFDDTGSSDSVVYKLGARFTFVEADVFDTQLSSPREIVLTASLNSMLRSIRVRPAEAGTLRIQAWAGTSDTDPVLLDLSFTTVLGDIGNLVEFNLANPLFSLINDENLVRFSGIELFGGLQTSGNQSGNTTPYIAGDVHDSVIKVIALEDEYGSVDYANNVLSAKMTIGDTVPKGTVMSSLGWNPTESEPIAIIADSRFSGRRPCFGVTRDDVTSGDTGVRLLVLGELQGIETTGILAGARIFMGQDGGFTPVDAEDYSQKIGYVLEQGNATDGRVFFDFSARLIMNVTDTLVDTGGRDLEVSA